MGAGILEWITAWLGEVWWREWWAWGILAALCGIFELILPGYIFLGFAIGASAMAGIFLIGDPLVGLLPGNLAGLMVVFAVLSILAWIALRLIFRLPAGQVKTFRHDINED